MMKNSSTQSGSLLLILFLVFSYSCDTRKNPVETQVLKDPGLTYQPYKPQPTDRVVSRAKYKDQLYGFWLGQCIANWTGLVTEMDKVGNIGDIKTGNFYTREDRYPQSMKFTMYEAGNYTTRNQ